MAMQTYNGMEIDIPAGWQIMDDGSVVDAAGNPQGDYTAFPADASAASMVVGPRTWGDIQRQSAANARELGVNAGIGTAGALAKLALEQSPTATDVRNDQKLAGLEEAERKGTLGLDAAERQQAEADLLNPARAEVTERRARTGDRLASMGNASLASQQAMEAADAQAAQRGLVAAGAEVNRANISERRADERELEERTQYKANQKSALLNSLGGAITDLAKMGGKIAAAQAGRTEPTDAQLDELTKGKAGFDGMTADEKRAAWKQEQGYQTAKKKAPVNLPPSPYKQDDLEEDISAGVM
jgi:hypothetical protein